MQFKALKSLFGGEGVGNIGVCLCAWLTTFNLRKMFNFTFCRVASTLTRETIAVLDIANPPLPTTLGFVLSSLALCVLLSNLNTFLTLEFAFQLVRTNM